MIDLEKLVAVSSLSGLYRMAANRSNGLVLENIDSGKRGFYASRKYQFTPLESISIYTIEDSVELGNVFATMKQMADNGDAPADVKSDTDVLFDYFERVLPSYDRERVYIGDVKRVIKWYNFLAERDMLVEKVEEATEEEAPETEGEA